ncbi:MAG: putative Ig domain-containing protein, partial [Zoogloeaceae bacterium]|nr:putative Ig domain-containing protein [Zoogloeaceae bacterium]
AGQKGSDHIEGGDGDDVLYGDEANALPGGWEGNDTLIAGHGADRLFGGGGDDRLWAMEDDGEADVLHGGEGNDDLRGGTGGDKLYGEAGNDLLIAGMDGSELDGGEGADTLYASAGNDVLKGGEGDDRFYGNRGADEYLGGAGADVFYFSTDLLFETTDVSVLKDASAEDRLVLDGARLDEVAFVAESEGRWRSEDGHVLLMKEGETLNIQTSNGVGRIVVERFVNGALGLFLPELDDNQAPVVAVVAANLNVREDEILNIEVSASLFADPDGDALAYTLTLEDGAPLPDWIAFHSPTRTLTAIPGNEEVGVLGLRLTATDPEGLSASQTFTLTVENVNDAPESAGEIEEVEARAGERFIFVLPATLFTDPDGDELRFDVTLADDSPLPSWLVFDVATRTLSGTPEHADAGSFALKVTATDPEGLSASQSFVLAIEGVPAVHEIAGTSGDDSLYGTADDERILGFSGDDGLFGDAGNDHLLGGEGDDRLFSGTGENRLEGGAGNDLLYSEGGDNLLFGGAGDDRFFGGAGDDILDGGEGSDRLFGGAGDDVYVLRPGDGNDVLVAYDPDADAIDALRFDGVASTALRFDREGAHLIITYGAHDRVTLENHYQGTAFQIDRIECADGSFSAVELLARVPVWLTEGGDHFHFTKGGDIVAGLGGDDSLYGDDGDDVLSGEDGNDSLFGEDGNDHLLGGEDDDRLFGGEGDDRLEGGTGNDTLYGESGNDCLSGGAGDDLIYGGTEDDRLHGGTGDDHLYGGTGGDTYVFIRGDGEDVMRDYDTEGGSADTLEFGEIGAGELWFARNGNNLEVRVLGGNDKVTIQNWYLDALYRIETFRTEEAVLKESEVQSLVEAMSGYAEPQEANLPEGYEDLIQIIGSTWESV